MLTPEEVFELPWPDDVWIISQADIGPLICGPEDQPQSLWGHLNNAFRKEYDTPLRRIHVMTSVFVNVLAYVSYHVHRSKNPDYGDPTYVRSNPLRNPFVSMRYSADVYNATWAALGYVTNQSDACIHFGELAWQEYIKQSTKLMHSWTPRNVHSSTSSVSDSTQSSEQTQVRRIIRPTKKKILRPSTSRIDSSISTPRSITRPVKKILKPCRTSRLIRRPRG